MDFCLFLGVLWTAALWQFIFYLTHYKFDPFVWGKCKVGFLVMYFCASYSSSLLVILSVEKFIALYFPLKTKTLCTVHIAKRVSIVSAVLFLIYNAQFLYIGGSVEDPDGNLYCDYVNTSVFYYKILQYTFMTLYIFGPFIIMLLANIAITYKFITAKLRTRQGGTESTVQALSKSAMKGTAMLLTVSFVFIILMAPIGVANLIWVKIPNLVLGVTVTLEYVNHGINGVLYCISGSRFRAELVKTFDCFKKNSNFRTTNISEKNTTVISEVSSTVP